MSQPTTGIVGAGAIGQAFARQAARVGYSVLVSNSRGPESLAWLVESLGTGARSGTTAEAAASDVVVLTVPWRRLQSVVENIPSWDGRIVIDATNPIGPPDFQPADLQGRTSSEVVAGLLPTARLVKACNTLTPELLGASPYEAGGRRVLFVSGDEDEAKTVVMGVLERIGFAPVDLGSLSTGGRLQQFPGGPLPALNLIRL